MNFKNMSIKKSLIVGFGTTILISVIIIVASLIMMNSQKKAYTDIIDRYVKSTQLAADCRINYNIAARNLRDSVLSGNTSSIDTANSKISELASQLAQLESFYPLDSKDELNAFVNDVKAWMEEAQNIGQTARTDRNKAGEMIVSTCTPALNAAAAAGDELAEALEKAQEEIIKQQNTTSTIGIAVIIVVMVIATFVVLMMATKIIKSIAVPTAQVREALVGFSQGNLAVPVDYTGKNELGEMCDALRTSQHVLSECIGDTCHLLEEMGNGNFDVRTKDEKVYVGALSSILTSVRTTQPQPQ